MKEYSGIARIIDTYTARFLKTMFMACYKRGVNDAHRHGEDEGMLREHVDMTHDCRMFGFVGNATGQWVYWKNRLCDIAEDNDRYRCIHRYFDGMKRFGNNYLSVMMVMAQTFYNRGITDWLDNPEADDLTLFNGACRWWGAKRDVDTYRIRGYVQDVCSEHIDAIVNGGEDVLKQHHYEIFRQAFSFAIMPRRRI